MSQSDAGETHYEQNKERIIQGVMARKRLIRGSDEYIQKHREVLIHAVNAGERKCITTKI